VNAFLEKFSGPASPIHSVSEDAIRRIMGFGCQGNIRQLENSVERAVGLGRGDPARVRTRAAENALTARHLPPRRERPETNCPPRAS